MKICQKLYEIVWNVYSLHSDNQVQIIKSTKVTKWSEACSHSCFSWDFEILDLLVLANRPHCSIVSPTMGLCTIVHNAPPPIMHTTHLIPFCTLHAYLHKLISHSRLHTAHLKVNAQNTMHNLQFPMPTAQYNARCLIPSKTCCSAETTNLMQLMCFNYRIYPDYLTHLVYSFT